MQNKVLSLTLKYLNYHTAMRLYHREFRNRDCDKQSAEHHLHEELVEELICSILKDLLFACDVELFHKKRSINVRGLDLEMDEIYTLNDDT